ncbi:MAG: hypothetical protein ACRCVT_10510 [Leadbetterella sp.]
MNLDKNICIKLYLDVKSKLQELFIENGLTFRNSETAIWKFKKQDAEKTFAQELIEKGINKSFSGTYNTMYLWKKQNEAQKQTSLNFHEDYLYFYVDFLGYENPQAYIKAFSISPRQFFAKTLQGDILVVQPIFDAHLQVLETNDKAPLPNEQTLDSRDTECLLELIDLFHSYNQALPKRVYDQQLVSRSEKSFYGYNLGSIRVQSTDCIFSIGFYSNFFTMWVLNEQLSEQIEYYENPSRFRIKYFNSNTKEHSWTDFYQGNDNFDIGFLLKHPVRIEDKIIDTYLFCGLENKATKAITDFLCQNWSSLSTLYDMELKTPIHDRSFVLILKVNKTNVSEYYLEKMIIID